MMTIKAGEVKLSNIEKIESNLPGLCVKKLNSSYLPKSFASRLITEIKSLAKKTPREQLEWLYSEWEDSRHLSPLGKKTLKEAIELGF